MCLPRVDGRTPDELRKIIFERGCNLYAEGSALVTWGNTKVLCTATVEEKVPSFLRGSGSGWVTAEYAMLPRSTHSRSQRDISKGKLNGRCSEIQRLIGRSLRAAVDLAGLGERSLLVDCDVLQADGGTRTAAISVGFVALFDALRWLRDKGRLDSLPLKTQVGAVSVGKIGGEIMLDLCYEEDSAAEVDANVVMTGCGNFIEFQGTGEGGIFSRKELDSITAVAWKGIAEIQRMQRESLAITQDEESLFSC